MATQFPSSPSPSFPPLNPAPSPLNQAGGQSPDLNALSGGLPGIGQLPSPLQNGPQLPPTPPTAPGVGNGFSQFA